MSNNAKWVISVICAIVGVIALIYAVIYLAVPIHSLPGFVPGQKAGGGHYHKRAFLAAVIGVVLLAIAIYLGMTIRRSTSAGGSVSTPAPAGSVAPGAGSDAQAGDS